MHLLVSMASNEPDMIRSPILSTGHMGNKKSPYGPHFSTLVAGFTAAGYSAVWKAMPGSCKLCMLMNDQTVTTLTPPLHKGCGYTVDIGESV